MSSVATTESITVDTATRCTTYISKLQLQAFRNYAQLDLSLAAKPVVITGPNGSGKTNILEALSLLAPGRGLRNAKLDHIDRFGEAIPWAVSSVLSSEDSAHHIGTGRMLKEGRNTRLIKIDHEPVTSQARLTEYVSVSWQTPQMDGLFLAGLSERRQFMDALVFHFNNDHAKRVQQYEYHMRERNRLLQERGDAAWIGVLEQHMAELAVAIAAARMDMLHHIQAAIDLAPSVFPKADLMIDGLVEKALANKPALEVEQYCKEQLFSGRGSDQRAGRTLFGTHRSDLVVAHRQKEVLAAYCSTGEQKALLLTIILAEIRAQRGRFVDASPILLLDEVVAHLDSNRRAALFEEILDTGTQAWLTGTDASLFEDLLPYAQHLKIDNGVVDVLS